MIATINRVANVAKTTATDSQKNVKCRMLMPIPPRINRPFDSSTGIVVKVDW